MPSATPLRSSALNGSMSRTSTPITFVRLLRRLWPARLAWYPSSSITVRIRAEVVSATP